jgi:hypothetical protein
VIGIALDRQTVEAGEFLTGAIQWAVDGERSIRQVIVIAEWKTAGEGNCANGISRIVVLPVATGRREGSIPFRILIPHEGPVSFSGELVSVGWQLRAHVDRRGLDESANTPFAVVTRCDNSVARPELHSSSKGEGR